MSKRQRRAERERERRWKKREEGSSPGVKNLYGVMDLTPHNASNIICGLEINYGGRKWL